MIAQRIAPPMALRSAAGYAALLALACIIAYGPLTDATIGFGLAAVLLVVLIVPWLPWLALAALLPLLAAMRLGPATPADLLLGGSITLWLAAAIARRSVPIYTTLPLWSIFVLITAQLAALLTAVDLGEGLVEVVKWGEFAAILAIVPAVVPRRYVGWLVAALLTGAAVQGLLGLYQFIFRIGPDWFLIQGRFMRASGLFRQPNPYAGYLGLTLPLAFSVTLWALARWWQARTAWGLLLLIGAGATLTAIATGLVASWSRGGWLGALAAVTMVMLLFSRTTRWITFAGGAVGAIAALMGSLNPAWIPLGIRARLAEIPATFGAGNVLAQPVTDENFAVIERLAHWVAALRMWESNIWFGVGPGNYNAAYASVALPRWSEALGHAHNIYLNVLAETGLVGFGAFCLMWLALTLWIVRCLRTSPAAGPAHQALAASAWTRALAVGCVGMLAHLAIHSLFDNLFVQGIYLHIALSIACLAAACPTPERRTTASSESRVLG